MFKKEDERTTSTITPRPVAMSTLAHPVRRKFEAAKLPRTGAYAINT